MCSFKDMCPCFVKSPRVTCFLLGSEQSISLFLRQFQVCHFCHHCLESTLSPNFSCIASQTSTLDMWVCERSIPISPSVLMTEMLYSPNNCSASPSSSMLGCLPASVWNPCLLIVQGSMPGKWASHILITKVLLGSPLLLVILLLIDSINILWLPAMWLA